MKKEEIQKLIETTFGTIKNQELQLDTGETVRIKLTKLSLNGNTPYTPTIFNDGIIPGMRHFIFAGDGKYNLKDDLVKNGIQDDYIIALEPKKDFCREVSKDAMARGTRPIYSISNILKAFQRIKNDPSLGIYRHEVIAPNELNNSLCAVFIKIPKDEPQALYLKRYFEAADHRTYQNVRYTEGEAEKTTSISHLPPPMMDWPKNLLVFGAPGTGKSFAIDKKIKDLECPNCVQRVTFYEDYSYEKFVGAYVPKEAKKTSKLSGSINHQDLLLESAGDGITYEFVPGPFLKMVANALIHENIAYILVIEEINRANAASVFGDMFQLLDRKESGESEYGITVSSEIENWLIKYLKTTYGDDADKWCASFDGSLKLPPNIYLWATMNSADQGVFPLDSAFKRRWSFLYKSVMEKRTDNHKYLYTYVKDDQFPVFVSWDGLRKAINDVMCNTENNVEEDRCLGAWYFKPAEMQQVFEYTQADEHNRVNLPNPLCDKLFHYLRQDVFRNNPGAIFNEKYLSMYKLRDALAKGTPLLKLLNLPQDSLKNCIIPANEMKFMVEAGKDTVTLDQLAKMASDANVQFDKQFVFNMNNACRAPHQLNEEQQKELIEKTLSELKNACTPPEAFETLRAQFKTLPDAPNANSKNDETKESEQNSTTTANTPTADTVADQTAATGATQENSQ